MFNPKMMSSVATFAVACDHCQDSLAASQLVCWASVFCHSDGAFLCHKCDALVHSVNKIAQRHMRVPYYSCPVWAYREAKARGRLREGSSSAISTVAENAQLDIFDGGKVTWPADSDSLPDNSFLGSFGSMSNACSGSQMVQPTFSVFVRNASEYASSTGRSHQPDDPTTTTSNDVQGMAYASGPHQQLGKAPSFSAPAVYAPSLQTVYGRVAGPATLPTSTVPVPINMANVREQAMGTLRQCWSMASQQGYDKYPRQPPEVSAMEPTGSWHSSQILGSNRSSSSQFQDLSFLQTSAAPQWAGSGGPMHSSQHMNISLSGMTAHPVLRDTTQQLSSLGNLGSQAQELAHSSLQPHSAPSAPISIAIPGIHRTPSVSPLEFLSAPTIPNSAQLSASMDSLEAPSLQDELQTSCAFRRSMSGTLPSQPTASGSFGGYHTASAEELGLLASSLATSPGACAKLEAKAKPVKPGVMEAQLVTRIERPDGSFKELDPERAAQLYRYRQKRMARLKAYAENQKKIRYECRKVLADARPRVKGRFAKASSSDNLLAEFGDSSAGCIMQRIDEEPERLRRALSADTCLMELLADAGSYQSQPSYSVQASAAPARLSSSAVVVTAPECTNSSGQPGLSPEGPSESSASESMNLDDSSRGVAGNLINVSNYGLCIPGPFSMPGYMPLGLSPVVGSAPCDGPLSMESSDLFDQQDLLDALLEDRFEPGMEL